MHKNGPVKLFISIPQNGRTDEDVEIEKDQIRRWAEHGADPRPVELIDTYIHEDAPFDGDKAGVWYLGESLKRLAAADFAIFATRWGQARGCRIEKAVCEAYNIPHTILEHHLPQDAAQDIPIQIPTVADILKQCPLKSVADNTPLIAPPFPRRGAMYMRKELSKDNQ